MGKAKTQRIIANVMALTLAVSAIPVASRMEVNAQTTTGDAGTYTDGTVLTQVGEAVSPDGNTVVSIKTDDAGRYFYSVRQNGEDIIYASRLGLKTEGADFTSGVAYQQGTIAEVTDDYQFRANIMVKSKIPVPKIRLYSQKTEKNLRLLSVFMMTESHIVMK